jgi:hypothetical protein
MAFTSPYARQPYDVRAPRIADLLLRRGDVAAAGARAGGETWGTAIGQIGQAAAGGLQSYAAEQKAEPLRLAQLAQIRAGTEHLQAQTGLALSGAVKDEAQAAAITQKTQRELEQDDGIRSLYASAVTTGTLPTPQQVVAVAGPERGLAIVKMLAALQPDNIKHYKDVNEAIRDAMLGLSAMPEDVRAGLYPGARKNLLDRGIITEQDAPEAYDPHWWAQATHFGQAEKTPPALMNLGPQGVFDPQTRAVIAGTQAPERADPNPTPASLADRASRGDKGAIEALRYLKNQQASTTVVPVVVQTPAGPQLLDRATGTTRPILDTTGQPVKPALSAQERMDARKFDKAEPVLQSITELSEKINTSQGVIAKLSGGAEKLKAQANLNDDVAEYQALISGFTPLVARSLGHTGVLTEQDVQSVRKLFPDPSDSKSLRDRKIARIRTIVGALQTTEHPAGVSGPREGDTKPIDGYPGTEQTFRGGKWIRTK